MQSQQISASMIISDRFGANPTEWKIIVEVQEYNFMQNTCFYNIHLQNGFPGKQYQLRGFESGHDIYAIYAAVVRKIGAM